MNVPFAIVTIRRRGGQDRSFTHPRLKGQVQALGGHSSVDRLCLDWFTTLFGTADRVYGPAPDWMVCAKRWSLMSRDADSIGASCRYLGVCPHVARHGWLA
jgi:hypothetical protein